MAKKSALYRIYEDLVNALKGVIETKYIFTDRPDISDASPMKKFAVINLPVSISDYVIGHRKTMLTTSGVLYLFTADTKVGTLDVNLAGDFVDSVVDLFPISGKTIVAVNPTVLMRGSDKQGFQVTTISFDLRSKWGVLVNK